MKYSFLLFAITALALPHGPDEDEHPMKPAKSPAKSPAKTTTAAAPANTVNKPPVSNSPKGSKVKTPAGCNALSTDAEFPEEAVWRKAFPNVVSRSKTLATGVGAPDYTVRVMNYKQVQEAVKFAAKNNLRLSVITSGHDFLGRNDAPSGLTIDTSLLKGVTVHESFEPTVKGAPLPGMKANVIKPVPGKQAAVTIGVGIVTQVLNDALAPSKLVTVGAAHGSVAPAGGFGQTAGHSPISTRYGLGADNILEFKVVTPDGELRVANKVVNQDLYWALRGGGGSTFGVVVEATLKAHPDIPITMTTIHINSTVENGDGMWEAYAELHRNFPEFVEKLGIAGYYYIYPTRITAAFLHQAEYAGKANAEKVWEPLVKKLLAFPDLKLSKLTYTEYSRFKDYFDDRFGAIDKPKNASAPAPVMPWDEKNREVIMKRHEPEAHDLAPAANAMTNLDSRLLGAEHFKSKNLKELLKASAPFALGPGLSLVQGHLISGNMTHRPSEDSSVLPAWRKAYAHVIGYKVPGKSSVDSLRKLAPESGAYANEAWAFEENWKQTFWGTNYAKLSQIKTKYDPKGLLYVTPGINADLYEAREGRVCKRTTPYAKNTAPESDNPNRGRVMKGSIN